jgi:hypothetical protein
MRCAADLEMTCDFGFVLRLEGSISPEALKIPRNRWRNATSRFSEHEGDLLDMGTTNASRVSTRTGYTLLFLGPTIFQAE